VAAVMCRLIGRRAEGGKAKESAAFAAEGEMAYTGSTSGVDRIAA
jgi:hypothetical protein